MSLFREFFTFEMRFRAEEHLYLGLLLALVHCSAFLSRWHRRAFSPSGTTNGKVLLNGP